MSQSLLFINFNKFGDTLLQTQLISGLKSTYPTARIGVICSPQGFEVLTNNPKIDYLSLNHEIPEKSPFAFYRYLMQCQCLVRQHQVDTIICDKTNSTPVIALMLNLLSVPKKIYTGPCRLPVYDLLAARLTRVGKDLSPEESIRKYNQLILSELGVKTAGHIEIYPKAEEIERSKNLTSDLAEFICVAPFSSQNATHWPEENIVSFINLAQKKFNIVIIGTQKDISIISGKTPRHSSVRFIAPNSIREAFAIAKISRALITLDSAPAHFLQALSIPVLKLNSARIPEKTWGYNGDHRYHFIQRKVPCGPCFSSQCSVAGHPCMREISAQMVLDEIEKLIS